MAQVKNGSIETNESEGRSLVFKWFITSTNNEKNYTEIWWEVYAGGSKTSANLYTSAGDFKFVIDGETVYDESGRINLYYSQIVGHGDDKLARGYKKLYHDNEGNKTFSVSIKASIFEFTVDNTASGTWELPTIPRYLSITSLEITNKTETSVVVKWSVSHPRNSTYYTFDNGATWIGSATDGETLASDGKSGSFNIKNLTPNKAYSLKVRFKRTDNALETISSAQNFTTYNYPYCNSAPDFTIGNTLKIGFYNPLNRVLTWQILGADGSNIATDSTQWEAYTGITSAGAITNLYKSIPNAKSGTYKVKVTYGNSVSTITGGKYSIKGTEVPTINTFNYIDNNASTVAITGNNQHIVQNKSVLLARFSAATPNNGAGSITKYTVKCNGKTVDGTVQNGANMGVVNSENNVDLALTVTDSRGLTATKTIKVTVLAHSDPTAVVTLKRLNNYEDETRFTVDASVSSVNGKNALSILYRYKVSGGKYGSYAPIGDNETKNFTLDKNNVYVFDVTVTDLFGSQFKKEYTLGKGVFPLFIDTAKNSVGINCFPTKTNSLEVNGANLAGRYKQEEQQIGFWVDEKPLYMKVFYVASPTVTTNGTYAYATYDTSDLNTDFGFIKGAYLKDSNYTFTLPYTNSMGNMVKVYYDRTNQRIEIASNVTTYSGQYCYIILCYTKKTS